MTAEQALKHPWIMEYRHGEVERGIDGMNELFKENLMYKNNKESKKL